MVFLSMKTEPGSSKISRAIVNSRECCTKNMSILEMRSVVDILKILYRGIMVGLVNGGFFTNEAKVIFGGFVGV